MILNFRINRPGQKTVDLDQTAPQGPHCLPFRQRLFDSLHFGEVILYKFKNKFSGVRIFEPTHEIMALIALRKLNFQTRMRSSPLALHV